MTKGLHDTLHPGCEKNNERGGGAGTA